MNSALSSASAADDMTALTILLIVTTAQFLVGNSVLLDINNFPSSLLLAFVSVGCEALLWPARIISLVWCVMMAYGWVDT